MHTYTLWLTLNSLNVSPYLYSIWLSSIIFLSPTSQKSKRVKKTVDNFKKHAIHANYRWRNNAFFWFHVKLKAINTQIKLMPLLSKEKNPYQKLSACRNFRSQKKKKHSLEIWNLNEIYRMTVKKSNSPNNWFIISKFLSSIMIIRTVSTRFDLQSCEILTRYNNKENASTFIYLNILWKWWKSSPSTSLRVNAA